MSSSFYHEDLLVTNLPKFTRRYNFIMHSSKALTLIQAGGGGGTFGPGAYFDPKYLFSTKPM